jgi:hypothetical protein
MVLRARAIRYGYKESAETRVAFTFAGAVTASPPAP